MKHKNNTNFFHKSLTIVYRKGRLLLWEKLVLVEGVLDGLIHFFVDVTLGPVFAVGGGGGVAFGSDSGYGYGPIAVVMLDNLCYRHSF